MFGDWYIVNLSHLLGVDKNATYIRMINGDFIPEYSKINSLDYSMLNGNGITEMLIKQIDINGTIFREMSSGLEFGSIISNKPLAVNINGIKPATNDEIAEYLTHMQGVTLCHFSRFDILSNEITGAYELYKPVLDRVKHNIKLRHVEKIKNKIYRMNGNTTIKNTKSGFELVKKE